MPASRFLHNASRRGFTLAEMSFVLLIVGIVSLIVFPALKAARAGAQQSLTQSNLAALMRAGAAFTHANGCLPCPTPAGASGAGFGRVRGAATGSLCGTCAVAEGIAPFASLGLPAATAKDGWGHWITMRIDPYLATNFAVVPPTAPCLASDPQPCTLGASQKGLCRAAISPLGTPVSVAIPGGATQSAALLFLSHGPNGFGAFNASPMGGAGMNAHDYRGPATSCTTSGGFELCNADGNASFVDAPASADPNDPFDDQLVYMDRNALIASLGQGACDTAW